MPFMRIYLFHVYLLVTQSNHVQNYNQAFTTPFYKKKDDNNTLKRHTVHMYVLLLFKGTVAGDFLGIFWPVLIDLDEKSSRFRVKKCKNQARFSFLSRPIYED